MGRLVWSDDFEGPAGSAPDPAKWAHQVGPGAQLGGNSELEYYTDSTENAYLDGESHLVIAATSPAPGVYHSARLVTLGNFARYHGTWQARIQFTSTPGCWPAFWMMGSDPSGYPACGEVDIWEVFGNEWRSNTVVWTPNSDKSAMENSKSALWDNDGQWHLWEMQWPEETGTFIFRKDGEEYFSVNPGELPSWTETYESHNPLYCTLNMAIGGSGGGNPADTQFPVKMLVDYVRVFAGAPD